MMETTWKEKVKRSTNEKPITDPALRQALERCGTTFDEEGRATNLVSHQEVMDWIDRYLIAEFGEEYRPKINSERIDFGMEPL
ncbi:MAG: hypothetical protein LBL81_02700 [Tannerella sp.]|nr:hypothetical protein [Tannerella sp.]